MFPVMTSESEHTGGIDGSETYKQYLYRQGR